MAAADLFSGVLPFVHTAEQRSFRRAARELGVTPAAVSKAVARLEEDLGVRLLLRTSRTVSVTPEGELFLARCRSAVAELRAARDVVADAERVAKGTLALTFSPVLGRLIAPRLAAFSARYPRVSFRVSVTDRQTRLVDEAIDVAVRIGEPAASSLVARRLRRTRWVTVASPAYLARAGTPQHPDDLAAHNCLKFVMPAGTAREWTFAPPHTRAGDGRSGTRARAPSTRGNLAVDQGEVLVDAVQAGLGIGQALDFMVGERLRAGDLVEVLAEHAADATGIYALWAAAKRGVPRVSAFVRFLVEAFARPE